MKTKGLFAIALFAILSLNSTGQEKEKQFAFEFNGGASFATRQLSGVNLNTGFGFEMAFHYRFMNHMGAYAGWGWNKFSTNENFGRGHIGFEETGYVMGLQFSHPVGSSSVGYYARLGGLYNHIEVEEGDNIIEDSGHGFGFQLSAGIDIALGSGWSINPGVKFNALSREFDLNGTSTDADLNYVMVRVGFVKSF